jgi:hypothetical protein
MLRLNLLINRQSAAIDLVLRSGTGHVLQFFRLRSGFDRRAGAESTRAYVDEEEVAHFGTVYPRLFLTRIFKDKLLSPEIQNAAGDIRQILEEIYDKLHGSSESCLIRMHHMVVYTSGRYIIRDEGHLSKDMLGRNFAKCQAKPRFVTNLLTLPMIKYSNMSVCAGRSMIP